MTSIRIYCDILDKVGFSNFSRSKKKSHYIFMLFQYSVVIFFTVCHGWNTFTRATRYLPEFFQSLYEDIAINFVVFQILCFNQQSEKTMELAIYMENSFCTINNKAIRKGRDKSKKATIMFFLFVSLMVSFMGLQTIIPLSSEEIELQANIYKTKHPERIAMSTLRIPFIDETESWYYEAIMLCELYGGFFAILATCVICTFIINIIYFMEAQYTILCQHIENLGKKLSDSQGQRFFYTNFKNNDIKYLSTIKNKEMFASNKRKPSLKQRLMNEKIIEQHYEKLYLRQIIYFHQKLMLLQQKMQILLTPIVLPLVVCTNLAFSICLYQLTDTSSSLSKVRKCKFLFEMITLTLQYFFLNNSSEIMDDCNAMVCRSINSSHWQHCTLDTKRGLMSLLRICQRPNHLEFYGGVIIPSRDFFLKVIKIAYSFVNFIRCT
uniref:Odorant receptor n=1 Tax=Diaphorina citri TaxID=121845 RepID=A0A7T3R158_DIACI|nr:odorant receptor 5 [Diaphorina citri]